MFYPSHCFQQVPAISTMAKASSKAYWWRPKWQRLCDWPRMLLPTMKRWCCPCGPQTRLPSQGGRDWEDFFGVPDSPWSLACSPFQSFSNEIFEFFMFFFQVPDILVFFVAEVDSSCRSQGRHLRQLRLRPWVGLWAVSMRQSSTVTMYLCDFLVYFSYFAEVPTAFAHFKGGQGLCFIKARWHQLTLQWLDMWHHVAPEMCTTISPSRCSQRLQNHPKSLFHP